jgi:uncharacterized protein YqiB (DUF1249 family)
VQYQKKTRPPTSAPATYQLPVMESTRGSSVTGISASENSIICRTLSILTVRLYHRKHPDAAPLIVVPVHPRNRVEVRKLP